MNKLIHVKATVGISINQLVNQERKKKERKEGRKKEGTKRKKK